VLVTRADNPKVELSVMFDIEFWSYTLCYSVYKTLFRLLALPPATFAEPQRSGYAKTRGVLPNWNRLCTLGEKRAVESGQSVNYNCL
jgi:hypothetical protein